MDPQSERLERIEAAVGSLTSSVSSLTATVKGLAETQAKHENRLEASEASASQRGRLDWNAMGFMLAFVGAIGFMAKEPMDNKIATNAQEIRDLDTTLQREMRLLDDALESEIMHLAEGREENRAWLLELDRRTTRLEAQP
jgi:hypothetical protein